VPHLHWTLIDHLDAASVARDVDAVRARSSESAEHLQPVLRHHGGAAVHRTVPQRVRALVLDSVDDHSLNGRGFIETSARTGQDTFDEFAAGARATQMRTARHGSTPRLRRPLGACRARDAARSQAPDKPLPQWVSLCRRSSVSTSGLGRAGDDLRTLTDQPPHNRFHPLPFRSLPATHPMPGIIACSDWQFDLPDQDRGSSSGAIRWRSHRPCAPTSPGPQQYLLRLPIPSTNPAHRRMWWTPASW